MVCVSIIGIIQREVGMRVDIIQREGCMRANEYRKYELLSCVNVMQRESCMGANECRKNERNDKLRKYEQHEGARV